MSHNVEYEIDKDYTYMSNGNLAPQLIVRISSQNGEPVEFAAVVDTGAEFSVFKADYLQSLGLNYIDGEKINVSSACNTFPVYKHKIILSVLDKINFEVIVGFSDATRRDLLGRDFLDMVQFGMREHHRQFFLKFEQ